MDNALQPVVISKDLCLVLQPRGGDSTSRIRSSLRSFFSPTSANRSTNSDEHSNCISAIYELRLNRISTSTTQTSERSTFSPGAERRQRKVIDTSTIYVRGEEMLHGWRPRRDSLILEHQQDLEKLFKIECVCRSIE